LHVMAIRALLEGDHQAARRIGSERGVGGSVLLTLSFECEGPGVAAVRVIGTANESAELAELDAEPAGTAARTQARIASRPVIRKEMPAQFGIEGGQHLANRQLLGVVDRRRKIPP